MSIRGIPGETLIKTEDGATDEPTLKAEAETLDGPAEAVEAGATARPAFEEEELDTGHKEVPSTPYLRRPGWGQTGRIIRMISNHFMLNVPNRVVFLYDLTVKPGKKEGGHFVPKLEPEDKKFRKQAYEVNRELVRQLVKDNSEPGGLFYCQETKATISPVYDGVKNIYTCKRLTGLNDNKESLTKLVTISIDGRDYNAHVVLKFATTVDLGSINRYARGNCGEMPMDAIKAVDIILRHGPTISRIPIGSGLFSPEHNQSVERESLGRMKDLTYGHYQSVKVSSIGVTLNVDRISAVFYSSGSLLKTMAKILTPKHSADPWDEKTMLKNINFTDSRVRNDLERNLKGLQVYANHLKYKRKYKIQEITVRMTKHVRFNQERVGPDGHLQDLGTITVPEYFEKTYAMKLQYQSIPCIKTGSKNRPVYLPMEVCEIVPDQSVKKKLAADELSKMIKSSSAQSVVERFDILEKSVASVHKDSVHYLNEFEITLGTKPIEVEGFVLKHSSLDYKGRDGLVFPFGPNSGKWDMRGKKVYDGATLERWLVINMVPNLNVAKIHTFILDMALMGNKIGLRVSPPTMVLNCRPDPNEPTPQFIYNASRLEYTSESVSGILTMIRQRMSKPELIVFVVQDKHMKHPMYQLIKYYSECTHGVSTQCISEKNIRNYAHERGAVLLSNLMLQINPKLGGINCVVSRKDMPPILQYPLDERCKSQSVQTMIVGADVSHPSPADRITTSIAAVVGSIDGYNSFYTTSIRVQLDFSEIIVEMKVMMKEILDKFQEQNGVLPQNIIFYRDGVSDGMFKQVMDEEVKQMKACFEEFGDGFPPGCPRLTFIVVQKRHHTRLKPADVEQDGVGRGRNIPPGTTIDKKIVHPVDFDFFMCSHEGIQGTSRPTHYYVLMDENQLSPDDMYQMTYNLCHVYAVSTRSISIPAPVQYSHLAAYRTRHHIISSGVESHLGRKENREWKLQLVNERIRVHPCLKDKMYFL